MIYTALSVYPFSAAGIKVAVATTKDFKNIDEKHLVTPFNAKAMVLFPEKINGKYVALLTAHTDMPPVKICLAEFDKIEDIWSKEYWDKWHSEIDEHRLTVKRRETDQVERGAVPIKTKSGWLVVYSHIQNYYSNNKIFGIEALLLDLNDPKKILARTTARYWCRKKHMKCSVKYRMWSSHPVFISGHKLHIYYGQQIQHAAVPTLIWKTCWKAYRKNRWYTVPIVIRYFLLSVLIHGKIRPVFNPAAIDLDGTIHLIYRAMGDSRSSVMGYASTKDGINIDERLDHPIYTPRESFEVASRDGVPGFGCEDPRIIQMDDPYTCSIPHMTVPTRRRSLQLLLRQFSKQGMELDETYRHQSVGMDNKDSCLFPEKVNSHYLVFHRAHNHICMDPIKSLNFEVDKIESFTPIIGPRPGMWDGLRSVYRHRP